MNKQLEEMTTKIDKLLILDKYPTVIIPKFVADWIEKTRIEVSGFNFESGARFMMFVGRRLNDSIHPRIKWWINEDEKNATLLSDAIDFGYKIEANKWVVKEGDLVIRKGKHAAKAYFVESVGEYDILLVNGIRDEYYSNDDDCADDTFDYFCENFRLLAKSENLEKEESK